MASTNCMMARASGRGSGIMPHAFSEHSAFVLRLLQRCARLFTMARAGTRFAQIGTIDAT
jgi:hypothetical protein